MTRLRNALFACLFLFALPDAFSQDVLWEVTAEPNPTAPAYDQIVAAKSKLQNARGSLSTIVPMMKLETSEPDSTLPGSESYNYAVPILSLPGRNGFDLNLTLYYNSRVWTVSEAAQTAMFNADRDFPSYGFRLGYGYLEYDYAGGAYVLTEKDGSKRSLTWVSGTAYESSDSSYTAYDANSHYLKYKDGTQVLYEAVPNTTEFYRPIRIYDTNGNYISVSYVSGKKQAINQITDTVGRIIQFDYDANGQLLAIRQSTPGERTYASFEWTEQALNYNFSFATPNTPVSGTTINVLAKCTYTNGTGVVFEYGDWGIISAIKTFANGYSGSGYGGIRSIVSYNYPSASTQLSSHPAYTQQYICDRPTTVCGAANATSTWNFAVTKINGVVSSFTVTDPANTKTITNLFPSGDWRDGLTASVEKRTASNTLLESTAYTWTADSNQNHNPRIQSLVRTIYPSNKASRVDYAYTTYGNVSQVSESDWYGVPKRSTHTEYLTSSSYVNRHILDRATRIQVKAPDGTVISRSDFSYDGNLLTSAAGAPGHDDTNYSSSFMYRGLVTSITRYRDANTATGAVTRRFYYDAVGNLRTAELDCCTQRQWAYTATTKYAFPETVTNGPLGTQYSTSANYNLASGTVANSTDENGKVTSYTYDNSSRLATATLPNGVVVTTTYGDSSTSPTVTRSSTANSAVSKVTSDGLGRTIKQEFLNGASVISTRDTEYDGLSRPKRVSSPYAPTETVQYTNYTYDELDRPLTVTPPGNTGAYQYAYLNDRVTITDPAGKQKRTYSDALGRLVRVDEPGYGGSTSASATVTFDGFELMKPGELQCDLWWEGQCQSWSQGPDLYDTGTITVNINGYPGTTTFRQGSTPASVAAEFAEYLNIDPSAPVTGVASGATVTITSRQAGSQTNYSLSTSTTWDSANFVGASFNVTTSGATMTGGTDSANGPISIDTPLITLYTYNALDKLTSVTQGEQTRTYLYDSMGNLTSATTPETNNTAVNYTYTDFGAVWTRTDPRGVVTTYSYDGLHRIQEIGYDVGNSGVPATAGVTFSYGNTQTQNNVNRLLTMTDGTGSETYAYDSMGQVTRVDKILDGITYTIQYGYNLAGDMNSMTYPSGRVVSTGFDSIGRLQSVSSGGTSYLTVAAPNTDYNGAGQLKKFTFGNGVLAEFGYNERSQIAAIRYSNGGANDLLNLAYDYGTANNGQIKGIRYYTSPGVEDPSRSLNYEYDEWMRLKTGYTSNLTAPNTWRLEWGYDRYGNRRTQTLTGGTATITQPQFNISHTTNQINDAGISYLENGHNAGNMTNDGLNTYEYDAENRMVQVNAGSLTHNYDGKSLRTKTVVGTTTTRYLFSGTLPIAEYVNGTLSHEYIYAGGQRIARLDNSGAPTYLLRDHLSTRVENGATTRTYGHFPFGETWYETGTSTNKFTDYERDSSGLDYAVFRAYGNRMARFMTPDVFAGSPSDPQSLNRFAYSRNDPTNLSDPLGLFFSSYCRVTIKRTIYNDEPGYQPDRVKTEFITECDYFWVNSPWNPETGGGGGEPGGGGGGITDQAKKRLTGDCARFIVEALKAFFAMQNQEYKRNNYKEVSQETLDAQSRAATINTFADTLSHIRLQAASNPNAGYVATADGLQTVSLHPGWKTTDKPLTLIHEAFHLLPYLITDVGMANALGAPYKTVPGNSIRTMENASRAWDAILQKKCGGTGK